MCDTSGHFAYCFYFPCLYRAQKFTLQLAKYPRILYMLVKPPIEVYCLYLVCNKWTAKGIEEFLPQAAFRVLHC